MLQLLNLIYTLYEAFLTSLPGFMGVYCTGKKMQQVKAVIVITRHMRQTAQVCVKDI